RRHTRFSRDWSSDVCSSDLYPQIHPSYAHSLYPSLQHTGFKPRQLFGLKGEKRRDDLDSLAGLIPRARPNYRARNNYLIHTRAGEGFCGSIGLVIVWLRELADRNCPMNPPAASRRPPLGKGVRERTALSPSSFSLVVLGRMPLPQWYCDPYVLSLLRPFQPHVLPDLRYPAFLHAGPGRVLRPAARDVENLVEKAVGAAALDGDVLREGAQVFAREAVALAVHAHLVLRGPLALRVVAVRHVEGGRQRPLAGLVHEEGDVLDVIVLVADHQVEDHAAELLLHRLHAKAKAADDLDGLFIRVRARQVVVEVGEGGERLHVYARAVREAVEAFRHEVMPAVFLHQPAVAHVDAGVHGHEVAGVFDLAVALRVVHLAIAVAGNAVELQQPVFEALARVDLSRAHLVGLGVPGDQRLGARAAGGGADAQDVEQRLFGVAFV